MSIEKKSLISNRTATKKAIVTKPEVTKVNSMKVANRFAVTTRTIVPRTRMISPRLKNF